MRGYLLGLRRACEYALDCGLDCNGGGGFVGLQKPYLPRDSRLARLSPLAGLRRWRWAFSMLYRALYR